MNLIQMNGQWLPRIAYRKTQLLFTRTVQKRIGKRYHNIRDTVNDETVMVTRPAVTPNST